MENDSAESTLLSLGATAAAEGLVAAWRRHLPAIVKSLTPVEALKHVIRNDPSMASRQDGGQVDPSGRPRSIAQDLRDVLTPHESVLEADGSPVMCVERAAFLNWGRTVENRPAATFVPRTRTGVQNIVRHAASTGRRVRVSGYRHTWESLYSEDDQYLISLLPLDIVEDLPARHPDMNPADQLQGIEFVRSIVDEGVEKAVYRVGAATTNEQFRRWAVAEGRWTLPLNVIMVEITIGGSNAPICHGAGLRNRTLSDLVAGIEFVDARGATRFIDDPLLLKTVAGCFGLLGIVTAVHLRLDPMTYARMQPVKTPIVLTIPPPAGLKLPKSVSLAGVTQQQLDSAWEDFVRRAEGDYYAEWFWFPFEEDCWVNTWRNDGKASDSRDYPGPLDTMIQEGEEFVAQLANESVMKLLPGHVQASILARSAMQFLPAGQTIVTPLIDALHFRRGIQNMRVLDMEIEIPIPARADDPSRADWTLCQKAWWAAVCAVWERYERDGGAPMRIALEMRVMADSAITMAPQFGNGFGTCSIEVLTTPDTDPTEWLGFMQDIVTRWGAFTDAAGEPLNLRPHWAKQWCGLTVRGQPIVDYLKSQAYRDRLVEFGAGLTAAAALCGVTTTELKSRFSNPLLDDIFDSVL